MHILAIPLVLAAIFTPAVISVHDVDVVIPSTVRSGENALLECSYELGSSPLYVVKWYKNGREFYRYMPDENPMIITFPASGFKVLESASNDSHLTLSEVQRSATGEYTCEVVLGPPDFGFRSASNYMEVTDPQSQNPFPQRSERNVTTDLFNAIQNTCEKYSVDDLVELSGAGEETKPNVFPWMAALGFLDRKSLAVEFKCSGTIISDQFILTAAHCIKKNANQWPSVVRVGALNLSDSRGENYFVEELIQHQNYSEKSKQNDIALIRLTNQIVFTPDIRPACLETDLKDLNPEIRLNITRWSSQTSVEEGAHQHGAQVVTVPLSECNQTYLNFNADGSHPELKSGLSESQYCAHEVYGRSDGTWNNNGGSLQIIRRPRSAHIVGIASFGVESGTLPSVYTRVAYFAGWIAENVWPQPTN